MNGELMTRQGLPTGQMEQETQELLDEYNEEYCWEYNDMVDFIKQHGEKDFREYYEEYNRLVDDYGQNLVDGFIEDFDVSTIENFEDMYQGQLTGAKFAEETCTDCGYISKDMPSWIEIDWQKTWDNALSHDYTELIGGHIFNNYY